MAQKRHTIKVDVLHRGIGSASSPEVMIVAYLVLTALGIFTELVTMDNGTVHSRDITFEWIVFNRAKLVDIFSKRRLGKYEYIHEMQSSAPIRHFMNYLAQKLLLHDFS